MLTEGKWVQQFEKLMADYIGVKHAIACNSGTSALMLIFAVLKEKYNRVIVPALGFPATLNAALTTGYNTILKDSSEKDPFLMDYKGLETLKPTDIVVPVHLLGYPVKMEKIMELSKKIGFAVVEDVCEALGTEYSYKKTGSFGIANAFSFYLTHQFQAGELGCITTNDSKLAEKIRSIKNHGREGSKLQFKHKLIGYNFKALEICAAFAIIQLKQAKEIIKKRQENLKRLNKLIKNKKLILPEYKSTVSYLCYPVGVKKAEDKEKYIKILNDNGCETREMFPCLANQQAYDHLNYYGKGIIEDKPQEKRWLYTNANFYEKNFFYITIHQSLTDKELNYIASLLNRKLK